jgi:hypothetical protein
MQHHRTLSEIGLRPFDDGRKMGNSKNLKRKRKKKKGAFKLNEKTNKK